MTNRKAAWLFATAAMCCSMTDVVYAQSGNRRVPAQGNGGFGIQFGEGGGFGIGPGGLNIRIPGQSNSGSGSGVCRSRYGNCTGGGSPGGANINIPWPQPNPQPPRPEPQVVRPWPPLRPEYDPPYQPVVPYRPVPAPAPAPAPQPPRNTVAAPKPPRATPQKNLINFNLMDARASAETDARQEIEAEKAKGMLDTDIYANLKDLNDPKLLNEWNDVVQGGYKTEAVQAFLDKYGAAGTNALPQDLQDTMELRQEFAEYADALEAGTLTNEGKEQALADLKQQLAAEAAKPGKDPQFFQTISQNVTNMENFNTLGQLADAVQQSSNPFPPLVQGATLAGMPIIFVSELTGFPVMPVDPVPGAPPSGIGSTLILVHNPESNGQAVSYLLDSHSFSMAPGHEQQLERSYTISFDTGGGQQRKYQLAAGVYEWRLDQPQGWNLYKVNLNVVIDNSRYDGQFQYLLNNEYQSVGPGQVAEHTGDKPFELAFDPGNGGAEVRKLLKTGRYLVGIDPDYGRLDLFEASKVDAAIAEQPPYLSSTKYAGNNATRSQRVDALLAQMKQSGPPLAGGSGVNPFGNMTPGRGAAPGPAPARVETVNELLNSLKQAN